MLGLFEGIQLYAIKNTFIILYFPSFVLKNKMLGFSHQLNFRTLCQLASFTQKKFNVASSSMLFLVFLQFAHFINQNNKTFELRYIQFLPSQSDLGKNRVQSACYQFSKAEKQALCITCKGHDTVVSLMAGDEKRPAEA